MNEFTPYDVALSMKEIGFNEECLDVFEDGTFGNNENNFKSGETINAPLCQQAFRWFREEHGLFGEINLTTKN